uniref:Uncharacterized protein n=1 Tax=Neogobius melanostomus TaxID=47308 RepID=A0A8C6TSD7_9GOBI
MSVPPSELHLEALQCHFTWGLSSNHVTLLQLRDKLLDICPDESNPWRGHIYNLLGFLQTRLGHADEALSHFSAASEALRGPELLVNYSDLAWLHYERGEHDRSQEYLRRVEELSREYPTERDRPTEGDHPTEGDQPTEGDHPTEGDRPTARDRPTERDRSTETKRDHSLERDRPTLTERDHSTDPSEYPLLPEVLAEKAWTLMNFDPQKLVAAELFERALEEQPERVEWRSSQAIALMSAHKHRPTGVPPEALLKVQRAHEEDPGNMYLSAEYLSQRVKRGEQVEEEEVAALMPRIIERAHSSYSGLKPALLYYRQTKALDVAIVWAEEALEKHPDSRYVKCCAALCYKWRIRFQKDKPSKRHLVEKGVALLEEMFLLYPYPALVKEIDLADLYGTYDRAKAGEMYQKLLQRRLEPHETQMLYNRYAKHLQHDLSDIPRCLEYHRKAALIDHDSFFKDNSVKAIESFKKRGRDSIQAEIQQSPLSAHLEALQCHFTWELKRSRELLFSIRDRLQDLLPDESNPWRGHIYNLLGFLQTRLGCSDEALSLFSSASEALRGPALLVNYSDLAWFHYERGEPVLSQDYLQRVEELSREYPTERDQLLPEVYAEKAWTQMEVWRNNDLAARLFQKALEEEDERVEWCSAHVLASFYARNKSSDLLEQLRHASERDPENLLLRAEYLELCARSGQEVVPEAEALAAKVLQRPDRMHRHMKPLLELYHRAVSVQAAVDLAAKALDKRPDSRFLKACLAMCYTWRIQRGPASQELIKSTAALLQEVISLYPDSCFKMEIDLANVYSQYNHSLADAKLLYSELLRRDLEPTSKQILYNSYAKFLYFQMNDLYTSTQYHMMAAEIPVKSYCRSNSIKTLQKIKTRRVCDPRLRAQVNDFLLRTPKI